MNSFTTFQFTPHSLLLTFEATHTMKDERVDILIMCMCLCHESFFLAMSGGPLRNMG
ncbi:hypothetical protein Lalb_Chr02g0142061 [Lupinus albus]|uniref:Uncharacterized protein n=1 Tax=Lupinus albus TaxID=3870 RepID=A0A6A4QYU8_LUPAL|nr:hypothetical protein Lalb_Chr02g0142061 [Lupinus albus]